MAHITARVLGLRAVVLAATATGCVAGAPHDTLSHRYHCDGTVVTRTGDAVVVEGATASFLRRDKEGDHFATSRPAEGVEYAEYVVPRDGLVDATLRRYGAADSLRQQSVCVAEGGYTDALLRYMAGASVGEIAKQLALDEEEVRRRIGTALNRLRCRFLGGC